MTDHVQPTGPQSVVSSIWTSTYLPITLVMLMFAGFAAILFVDNNGDSLEAGLAIAGDMWHGPPVGYHSLADLRDRASSGLAAFTYEVASAVHATGVVRDVNRYNGITWDNRRPNSPHYVISFKYTGYNKSFGAFVVQTDESTAFLSRLAPGSVIEIFGRGSTTGGDVRIFPVEMIRTADGDVYRPGEVD